ncbi:MAG: hypothetical protein KGS09_18220 [Nitrospirae bacterium]|nr:hypothetical protein [Nitrospirota bacterium]MDE3041594.1 hypothetical protein [Nitrospirota bacterium]MDE3049703.1 hypothetical protein [Nitrospirota bacterium]MDE3218273.1 hypothetical protein [Nitrospirota bacterium]
MSTRLALPNRRNHITQKVRIAGQRTFYLSVHDDKHPAEIFLRVKGLDCSSELIGLYDVVTRLSSLALQYGAPLGRWEISSLEPNSPHVAPSSGTITSSTTPVSSISSVDICWVSTVSGKNWPMSEV